MTTEKKKCCDLCDHNNPSQVEYCDECPCHTMTTNEKKCEPDGVMYTSIPPQNKCKNCGAFWSGITPICSSTPPQTGDWRERFDRNLDGNFQGTKELDPEAIKSFISEVEREARAKGRQEAVDIINNLEVKTPSMHPEHRVVQFSRDLLEHTKRVFIEALQTSSNN